MITSSTSPLFEVRNSEVLASFFFAKLAAIIFALYLFHRETNEVVALAASHLVSLGVFSVLLYLFAKKCITQYIRPVGARTGAFAEALAWVVAAVLLGLLIRFGVEGGYVYALNLYDHGAASAEFSSLIEKYSDDQALPTVVLSLAFLIGAIDEEIMYRGVLQGHFQSKYGIIVGIILANVIFGLAHFNALTILVGFALSIVYILSGRLWVAVLAHASGNIAYFLVSPQLRSMTWEGYLFASGVSAAILISLCVAAVVIVSRRTRNSR